MVIKSRRFVVLGLERGREICRGFDNVTVDEIAAAADVGRMAILREALRQRDLRVAPIGTLRPQGSG